jgi:acetylornithine deacetylase
MTARGQKRKRSQADHAKVGFGTEAGLFVSTAGVPSVVIGPGAIAQAHTPDEFVEMSELEKCAGFVEKLIAHCASPLKADLSPCV